MEAMPRSPVTILYFYRTRWGSHDEFMALFDQNHWPILREQIASGRLVEVTRHVPRFHGDGRADWDLLVTIVYRDWAAVEEHSEASIAQRLFPDQQRHAAEERRRFELLEAHWDVVLEERPLSEPAVGESGAAQARS